MSQAYAKLLADLAPMAQYGYAGPDQAATELRSDAHHDMEAYTGRGLFPQVCFSQRPAARFAHAMFEGPGSMAAQE